MLLKILSHMAERLARRMARGDEAALEEARVVGRLLSVPVFRSVYYVIKTSRLKNIRCQTVWTH